MGNCFSDNQLKNCKNDIEFFDLKGLTFNTKVVDVYDGDTCTVVIRLKKELTKFKVRCLGYDSPEMKPSKDLKDRKAKIDLAYVAKNYFINRVTDIELEKSKHYSKDEIKSIFDNNKKIISIKCHGWDKYGRLLGEFFVDGVNLNNEMIKNHHGYVYDGGTKKDIQL